MDFAYIINVIGLALSVGINMIMLYKLILGKADRRFLKRMEKVLKYIEKARDTENITKFVQMTLDIITNKVLTDKQLQNVRQAIETIIPR